MSSYSQKFSINNLIKAQPKIQPKVQDEKFLNRVKVMSMCDKEFDNVIVYVDANVAFKTQFGYNISVLRIIYFKENKPVHQIKCDGQTFANKIAPKKEKGQFQYFVIENKLQSTITENGEMIEYYNISCPMLVKEELVETLKLKSLVKEHVPKFHQRQVSVVDFEGFNFE
ncbi:Hypothetical_protein [Hexamita inflata]|uniref:Hypothetical_protein n=1 Tax=Hexamita inflata TaxID=28002 RepID=A0AA86U6W2_9EUKA|nr:Hypothetical protein HINF_LOCUS29266 [Hexamita inflata]